VNVRITASAGEYVIAMRQALLLAPDLTEEADDDDV
jgi:hypothetical protein